MNQTQVYQCPACQSDAVASISGIHARSQSVGYGVGASRTDTAVFGFTSSSVLGTYLAPPRRTGSISVWLGMGLILVIIGILFILGCYSAMEGQRPEGKQALTMAIIFGFILEGIAVGLFVVDNRTAWQRRLVAERWQRQNTVWQRLLYCGRCNSVYDPVTWQVMRPEDTPSYLASVS